MIWGDLFHNLYFEGAISSSNGSFNSLNYRRQTFLVDES